jgi:hypothetical protein
MYPILLILCCRPTEVIELAFFFPKCTPFYLSTCIVFFFFVIFFVSVLRSTLPLLEAYSSGSVGILFLCLCFFLMSPFLLDLCWRLTAVVVLVKEIVTVISGSKKKK